MCSDSIVGVLYDNVSYYFVFYLKDAVDYCIEKLEYAPSVTDNAGYTPLHEACSQGHYHIAKSLLLFGADVSASAQGGIRSVPII